MPMTNVPGKAALSFVCMEITTAWPVPPREEVASKGRKAFAFSVNKRTGFSIPASSYKKGLQ